MATQRASRTRPHGIGAFGIGMLIAVCAGTAAADGEGPQEHTDPAAPPVAYDALFRLPDDTGADRATKGGLDRQRWEDRYAAVRGDLDKARASLAKAQSDLEAMARNTESWQVAAPGAQRNAENSPISYKLRQDIRQYRDDVGRAERRLRELDVEASLAGVPSEWREPKKTDSDSPPGS